MSSMRKKTIVWGFDDGELPRVLETLVEEGAVTITAWFGDEAGATHRQGDLFPPSLDPRWSHIHTDDAVEREVQSKLPLLLDALSREEAAVGLLYHELLDTYQLWFNYFFKALVGEKVQWVLFSDVPGRFFDSLLYEIARQLNVPVAILTQAPVSDRYFCVTDLNDFGSFFKNSETADGTANERESSNEIPHGSPMALASDLDTHQSSTSGITLSPWAATGRAIWSELGHRLSTGTRRQTLPAFTQILCDAFAAQRLLKRHETATVLSDDSFVYFSLPGKRERLSPSLHGEYCDQLLAIEHLRTSLPVECPIVVGNAQYADAGRPGELFFDRLLAIPNVTLAPRDTPESELISRSRFVATVGSNVGWRALLVGKPTMLFGPTWYQSFPGVCHFHRNLDHHNLELSSWDDANFSPSDFQAAWSHLMQKTWPGDAKQMAHNLAALSDGHRPHQQRHAA